MSQLAEKCNIRELTLQENKGLNLRITIGILEVCEVTEPEKQPAILYQCMKCGATVKSTELDFGIRCPFCRYRVLMKIRPPIVKRIKAR